MPIYEYVCSDCGTKFELLRSFSESNKEASCPKCNKNAKRVVSVCSSFSKDASGLSTPTAGSGSSCSSCGPSSCNICGL